MHGHHDDIALQATFNYPLGIVCDPDDNIYIADTGNFCIRKLTQKTGYSLLLLIQFILIVFIYLCISYKIFIT